MKTLPINLPMDEIREFCNANSVCRFSLFGSVTGDNFGPGSDVDVLVEFLPGHTPGLDFFSMQDELAKIIGRKVELHTPAFLSRYFRDEVMSSSEVVYEER